MAVKPIISTITPWDSTAGTNITFSYSGNLPVTAKAIIKNASTLETRVQITGTPGLLQDGRYSYTIPPNILKANDTDIDGNGNKYCIQISVADNSGVYSPLSDKEFFWCMEQPIFNYANPINDTELDTSYVQTSLVYSQGNGEKLHTYRHYLYDNSKNLLTMSEHFYDESGLSYSFKGLDNKTSYYVRAQGQTQNGMILDTDYVRFFINYGTPENYSILSLESDDNATVYGTTNLILIEANEDPADYIYINSLVQLIGRKITYEQNYKIARDFTLQIKITKVLYSGLLLKMYNKEFPDNIITLDSYVFDDGTLRYCLKAFNGIATYVLYTDAMNVSNDDYIVITIRRINNVFSLHAEKVES